MSIFDEDETTLDTVGDLIAYLSAMPADRKLAMSPRGTEILRMGILPPMEVEAYVALDDASYAILAPKQPLDEEALTTVHPKETVVMF